jgi:hypothetical protein
MCDAGTHSNRTDLASKDACIPVGPGFWAPAGSIEPIECTSSILWCPGATEPPFFGGQPHILEAGAQKQTITEMQLITEALEVTETQTVTQKEVAEALIFDEQESWSITAAITLDQELDETYNETAVRLELATVYGVPPAWLHLNATAGSMVLTVTIAPIVPGAPVVVSASDVMAAITAADASILTQALRTPATLTEAASLARENVTVPRTLTYDRNVSYDVNVTSIRNFTFEHLVTIESTSLCPVGTFAAGGLCIDCSPGSCAAEAGSGACLRCAAGSYQPSSWQLLRRRSGSVAALRSWHVERP